MLLSALQIRRTIKVYYIKCKYGTHYNNTEKFVSSVEDSVKKIGVSEKYFKRANFDFVKHQTKSLSNAYLIISIITIILGNGAVFSGCSSLTKLVFPNSLKTSHNGSFGGCSSLTELNLGASYESCGQVCGAPANLQKLVLSTTYVAGGTRFSYNAISKATFSTNLVIYYTGDYSQALALQANETVAFRC